MTAPQCATGCGRPSSAALCGDCVTALRGTLQLAATMEGDLDDAIARQLRHGGSVKRSGSESPLPIDLRASDAAAVLRGALGVAVGTIVALNDRWPSTTITGMARWLLEHVAELARHDRGADAFHAIRDAVARCVAVLDPPPELHPAGPCAACGRQLMAEPGADTAMCGCGMLNVGLIAMRAERTAAADVLGSATEISGALGRLGIRVSAGTIRMWVTRQRLVPRPGGKLAMSDVLALIGERDQRKVRA